MTNNDRRLEKNIKTGKQSLRVVYDIIDAVQQEKSSESEAAQETSKEKKEAEDPIPLFSKETRNKLRTAKFINNTKTKEEEQIEGIEEMEIG